MSEHIVIPARFCGPPDSANGGYACGTVAALVRGGVQQVTLRSPPPLDTPLRVVRSEGDRVAVYHEDVLVAEGMSFSAAFAPPAMVPLEDAEAAARAYRGFQPGNTFMGCFVCGPERSDGLRLFTGPVPGTSLVAAPWTPDESLLDPSGTVRPEIVWAALDCPTFFASTEPGKLALLGRMTAELRRAVKGGVPHVVVARPTGADQRKRFGTSAVYTTDGELCAVADAIWFPIGRS